MALVTTFATTPLVSFLFPPAYQKKLDAWKRGEIDWEGNPLHPESIGSSDDQLEKLQNTQVRRLLVYLRLDSLPSLFTFIALLGGERGTAATKVHRTKKELDSVPEGEASNAPVTIKRPLEVHGVRMIELSERTSSVMIGSDLDEYTHKDPVVNAFRTFAQLSNVAVSGSVSVVPDFQYAETLTSQASDHFSDLVLIPWTVPGSVSSLDTAADSLSTGLQDTFVREALAVATCNTAIFFNRGFGGPANSEQTRGLTRTVSGISLRSHREAAQAPAVDRSHHVYFPFFGGADDRAALRFVLQLAQNTNITVTIVHFNSPIQSSSNKSQVTETSTPQTSSQLNISERVNTEALNTEAASDTALLHTLRDSLPNALTTRVVFEEVSTTTPLAESLESARREIAQSPRNAGDLVVVGRGKHALIPEIDSGVQAVNVEMKKTLGAVAESIISGGVRGSVLVIQAGGKGLEA